MFALKHMEKDLRLTLETAGDLPLEVTRKVKAIYEQGLKQSGWAEEDFSGLIRLIR
jgi:3-hydroxyisobutyrate dehydrogenase-like beta-hydroxyacid dehydrogenase